jgi:hypothetical protein
VLAIAIVSHCSEELCTKGCAWLLLRPGTIPAAALQGLRVSRARWFKVGGRVWHAGWRFYLKCIGKSVKLIKQRSNATRFFFYSLNSVETDVKVAKLEAGDSSRRDVMGLTDLWTGATGLHI